MKKMLMPTLLLLLTFFGLSPNSSYANDAQRIVAIDGSISEIVYALGKGHLMVGRDTTTTFPEAATKLPSVGYMRQLSAEGILSLKPTFCLLYTSPSPRD